MGGPSQGRCREGRGGVMWGVRASVHSLHTLCQNTCHEGPGRVHTLPASPDEISGRCSGAARGKRGGVHRAPGPRVSGTSRRGLGCKPASPRRPGLSLLPCAQPTCPDSPHPGWMPNTSRGPRGRGDRSWGRAEKGGRGERGPGCPQSRGVLRRACEGPTEVKVDPRGRPGAVHRAEAGALGGRGWAAVPT